MQVKERVLSEQQEYEQQIHDLTFFLRTQVSRGLPGPKTVVVALMVVCVDVWSRRRCRRVLSARSCRAGRW